MKIWTFLSFCLFAQSSLAEQIRFCRPNNMVSAHPYIAEHEGYFAKYGLDIKFETATNAKICQDMLLANKAEIMVGADGPFTVAAPNNPPFKIVANLGSNPETAIFARKDRGITDFSSLKGKKIGYLPGTVSYFFVGRILKKYQMTMNEVSLISLQPPALSQALIGGSVDAISIWEPWGYNAKKVLGDNFVRLDGTELYKYVSFSIALESLAGKPEVEGIIRAYIDAEEFITKNPSRAQEILSKAVVLDSDILKELWKGYDFHVSISKAPLAVIEENYKLLQESNSNFAGQEIGDLTRYIDARALKNIDLKRVEKGL